MTTDLPDLPALQELAKHKGKASVLVMSALEQNSFYREARVTVSKLHVAAQKFLPEIKATMTRLPTVPLLDWPELLQRLPVWRDSLRQGANHHCPPLALSIMSLLLEIGEHDACPMQSRRLQHEVNGNFLKCSTLPLVRNGQRRAGSISPMFSRCNPGVRGSGRQAAASQQQGAK